MKRAAVAVKKKRQAISKTMKKTRRDFLKQAAMASAAGRAQRLVVEEARASERQRARPLAQFVTTAEVEVDVKRKTLELYVKPGVSLRE